MQYRPSKSIIGGVLAAVVALVPLAASAAPVEGVWVGTWQQTTPRNDNSDTGPEIVVGQRYVVRATWDDGSTVIDESAFDRIELTGGSNTLDLFVPMPAFDATEPFVYTQSEADHFFFGINAPNATVNFADGTSPSSVANVIGFEFEGNFQDGGAGTGPGAMNFVQLQNPVSGLAVTQLSRIMNFDEPTNPVAVQSVNDLQQALDVIVDAGSDISYNATSLVAASNGVVLQSNDLGVNRTDGEDFLTVTWSEGGVPLVGIDTGGNVEVAIENSGLSMTTSTTTWDMTAEEDFTLLAGTDSVNVSYDNATPMAGGSAVAGIGEVIFNLLIDDDDLAVNALIAGFEELDITALVDGAINATGFFTDLIATSSQSYSDAQLSGAFGAGLHNVLFTATDKAGASASVLLDFEAVAVPSPSTMLLVMTALLVALRTRMRRNLSVA